MMSLTQMLAYYPASLQSFQKNVLREYVQYKMLESIFASPLANKLSFLGGTALRIVYGQSRFSEDLDFDNFGLTEAEFISLGSHVDQSLVRDGLLVERRHTSKGAYRCQIKLPEILFANALSGRREEKIMIQIDTAPHEFAYQPERKLINKFDVFTEIKVTPLNIILSQKIYAVFGRRRAKGRDFFDIIFLLARAKPNYNYLSVKLGIGNDRELRGRLLEKVSHLDLAALARDVQPFLFEPSDARKIELFGDYLRTVPLA